MYYTYIMSIKENIEKYKAELGESIKRVQDLRENTIKNMDTKIVRARYNSFYDGIIIKKRSEIKDAIQNTETEIKNFKECIKSLKGCINLLNTLNNEIDTTAAVINKINIGTLEGRSRQAIEEHPPEELTEIEKEILNQYYNELKEIKKWTDKS